VKQLKVVGEIKAPRKAPPIRPHTKYRTHTKAPPKGKKMANLLDKARQGRSNAIAGLAGRGTGMAQMGRDEMVWRASRRHENVTFVSSRARSLAQAAPL
jgi:hypothetical protein